MEINALSFGYRQQDAIIHSLTATFTKGKITTIIGPNGSGKSTLLGLMSRNYKANSGQILLDGQSILSFKGKELARVLAVVHQQNDAPYDLTIERLVGYGRLPFRNMFQSVTKEDQEAIDWAIEVTELQHIRDKRLNECSGGQRQRAWIAMALAQKTQILFLDEPTTYLDMYYQIELLQLIQRLNHEYGITIVMVLHDINQAIRYSDEIKVIKDGQLIAEGIPKEIVTSELMYEVYGVNALIREDEQAGLHIVPISVTKDNDRKINV